LSIGLVLVILDQHTAFHCFGFLFQLSGPFGDFGMRTIVSRFDIHGRQRYRHNPELAHLTETIFGRNLFVAFYVIMLSMLLWLTTDKFSGSNVYNNA